MVQFWSELGKCHPLWTWANRFCHDNHATFKQFEQFYWTTPTSCLILCVWVSIKLALRYLKTYRKFRVKAKTLSFVWILTISTSNFINLGNNGINNVMPISNTACEWTVTAITASPHCFLTYFCSSALTDTKYQHTWKHIDLEEMDHTSLHFFPQ